MLAKSTVQFPTGIVLDSTEKVIRNCIKCKYARYKGEEFRNNSAFSIVVYCLQKRQNVNNPYQECSLFALTW